MGGMCIGSSAAAPLHPARRHPLRVYAVIELAIAACGLAGPVRHAGRRAGLCGDRGHGIPALLLRGVFAALCLLPPTILMGATLPAIARWVETTPRACRGSASSTAATSPARCSAACSPASICCACYDMASRRTSPSYQRRRCRVGALALATVTPRCRRPPPRRDDAARPAQLGVAGHCGRLLTIALSGATALGAEVVWTRLLSLLLGATTYTFSLILAAFLIGLGIGSSVGVGHRPPRTTAPRTRARVCQALLIARSRGRASTPDVLPYWPINPNLSADAGFSSRSTSCGVCGPCFRRRCCGAPASRWRSPPSHGDEEDPGRSSAGLRGEHGRRHRRRAVRQSADHRVARHAVRREAS